MGLEIRAQNPASSYTFSTIAGVAGSPGYSDGIGASAHFNSPTSVAVDLNGTLYVADMDNVVVRKIETTGVVTTLAGTPGALGFQDGTGASAKFLGPNGIATDSNGNVFVSDSFGETIRRITPDGVVTTVAGKGGVSGATDGMGTTARFSHPNGIAVDGSGNIFVADGNNHTIRKIDPMGLVTTIAGTAGLFGSNDGLGPAARFNLPTGIAVDNVGNLYVTDGNNLVRQISSAGNVITIAGQAGSSGSNDGTGNSARFNFPQNLTLDGLGNIFVADAGNNTIRKVTQSGVVTTLAGVAGGAGATDGSASTVRFSFPSGISSDYLGNLYIADTGNQTIRLGKNSVPAAPVILKQPASSSIYTGSPVTLGAIAVGTPLPSYQWRLNAVPIIGATSANYQITSAQSANAGSYSVIASNPSGSATSVAANLTIKTPIAYLTSTLAVFNGSGPNGLATDTAGNAYVSVGNAIEKVSPLGTMSLIAGSVSTAGSANGTGASAQFSGPTGLALDSAGNIYVADTGNNAIRRVTQFGVVSTVAGLIQGNVDGTGVSAEFNAPTTLAVDASGNIYVVDANHSELRKITPGGSTTTVLTLGGIVGLALDASGAPYVTAVTYLYTGHSNPDQITTTLYKVSGGGALSNIAAFSSQNLSGLPGLLGFTNGALAVSGDSFYIVSETNARLGNLYQGLLQQGAVGAISVQSLVNASSSISIVVDSAGRILEANAADHSVTILYSTGSAPNIISGPFGGSIAYGGSLPLSVSAAGSPAPVYQWQLNGVAIAGATSALYNATLTGSYTVTVSNPVGTVTSAPAVVTLANRLSGISTRAQVGTGATVEIAGFVISGAVGSTKRVLIRAVGPALAQFAVAGVLAQTSLTVFDSSSRSIAANMGWNTNSNAAQIATVAASLGEFPLQLNSGDSALLLDLTPGAYTAIVSGVNSTTGVGLAEVYEVSPDDNQLIAISTRATVGTGDNVAIAGFIITGTQACKLLIRAIGPGLAQFGLTGLLAQPSLSVVNASGQSIATNAGWTNNANVAQIVSEGTAVGLFPLQNGSADAVVLSTFPPGTYTAVVSGVGNSSGIALVEVYLAP